MCSAHYKRQWRYGDPNGGTHRADNSGICSIDGCSFDAKSLGMCSRHYQRFIRNGTAEGGNAQWGEPQRFIDEVATKYSGDSCLTWPYSRNANGYGTIYAEKGETTLVHRKVCGAVKGPPPEPNWMAVHSCGLGHEGCISPSHLRWATAQENSDDKKLHGTSRIKARGERHPKAKLTAADVKCIRRDRGQESIAIVAEKYGVKSETITAIYSRRNWAWLD